MQPSARMNYNSVLMSFALLYEVSSLQLLFTLYAVLYNIECLNHVY